MSINIKILIAFLFLSIFPLQKEKDKCLIIHSTDNEELYEIGTIANRGKQFYIILKFPDISKEKRKDGLHSGSNKDHRKKEELKAVLSTGVEMNPTSTSYNLQDREEIKNLPDNINQCDCATVTNFNLGMEFKLYIEKEDGWVTFDAKKFLVEE